MHPWKSFCDVTLRNAISCIPEIEKRLCSQDIDSGVYLNSQPENQNFQSVLHNLLRWNTCFQKTFLLFLYFYKHHIQKNYFS